MPQGDGLVRAITAAALAEQRDELAPSQVGFADYNQACRSAALANVRVGSKSVIRRCQLRCPVCV